MRGGGDCDENDTAIHPAAAEDGIDYVDDDCDGSYAVQRAYVSAFETLVEFNVTNTVASGGVADLNAGAAARASSSRRPSRSRAAS